MKRLEAFCDAVAAYHNYFEPESHAYEIRNPLMLVAGKNLGTPEGKRIFSCHRAGYASGLDAVHKYCELHPEESIKKLLEHFGVKMALQQERAVDFMGRCLSSTVSIRTSLHWLLEE